MRISLKGILACLAILFIGTFVLCYQASAQSSGTIEGIVKDPTGAVIPGANVEIHNPVSHYDRSTTTDDAGTFRFASVPFNPYHMTVSAAGFASISQQVEVRSLVTVNVPVTLKVGESSTTVTVEGKAGLIENDPVAHTDVDRDLFQKMPIESASSSV